LGKLTLYVEDFLASLEQYDETVKDGLKTELKKCALAVQRDAKKETPVDTGRLRGSIVTDTSNIEKYECEIGTNVEYAPYVEYGTYKMNGKPFLRPAYHTNTKKLIQKVKNILGGK
jgi:HK97 gp10 family phage protein